MLCIVCGLVNFVAPLVKVREILSRKRIGMEISPSMTVAQVVCSVLWLGVGVSKNNPVIAVPNGIGLCLSIFTAVLFAVLPIEAQGSQQLSSMTVAARAKAKGKGGRDAAITFMPVVNPVGDVDDDIDLQDLDALLEGESIRLRNGDGGSGDNGGSGDDDDDGGGGGDDGDVFDDEFLASLEDEELEEDYSLIG